MKIVRLTLAVVFALCLTVTVRGEQTQANDDKSDAKIEAAQKAASCVVDSSVSSSNHPHSARVGCGHRPYHAGPCIKGRCEDGTCETCDKCKETKGKICPVHGNNCQHNCLNNQYGYGVAPICPGKVDGVCPIHGYGHCPQQVCPSKINGVCPIHGYGHCPQQVCPGKINGVCPIHGYGPCPHLQQILPFFRQALRPAPQPYFGAQPLYVPREQYDPGFQPYFPRVRALLAAPPQSIAPPEPMPTYTTRGPRDFLNPKPPSIGY